LTYYNCYRHILFFRKEEDHFVLANGPELIPSGAAAANSHRDVVHCEDVSADYIILGILSRGEIVDRYFRLSVSAEGAITPKA